MQIESFRLTGDDALALDPGTWLLEASAGTGKTYTIVGIVVRLIIEQRIPIERCVLMTFTNAATAELRERLRHALSNALNVLDGQDPGDDSLMQHVAHYAGDQAVRRHVHLALISIDAALISTIHGFCNRLLREYALEAAVPLAAELDGDAQEWRQSCVHDILRDWTRNLNDAAASLFGDVLEPVELDDACQRLEQHPDLVFTGFAAVDAQEVVARLIQVQEQWNDWQTDIVNFFVQRSSILGNSYGPRELKERCQLIGELLVDIPDRDLLFELLNDLVRPKMHDKSELKQKPWYKALRALYNCRFGIQRSIMEAYRERLQSRPRHSEHLSYNDLLLALSQAVEGTAYEQLRQSVQERYQVVLVDEFQDTDSLQWRILKALFDETPDKRLFLIGDPKQAIYAFRGADVHTYLSVVGSAHLRRYTLDTNYRSDAYLISALNHVFSRSPRLFAEASIQFNPVNSQHQCRLRIQGKLVEDPLQLLIQKPSRRIDNTRRSIAQYCAQEIAFLLQHAEHLVDDQWIKIQASDIAVLVRNHAEATMMAEAIATLPQSINSVRVMKSSVFASVMAREIASILAAILAPHRERKVRAAALTRLAGLSVACLANDEVAAIDALVQRLRNLRQLWLEQGFASAWQSFLDHGLGAGSARALAAADADGERHLTDLLHLGDLLIQYAHDDGLGPDALLQCVERYVADPHNNHEEQEQRLDRDDTAVRIMTMHVSKGLEFPICFAPYLWATHAIHEQGIFYQDNQACWHFGLPNLQQYEKRQQEALAEELRLAYVALTRARYRCYVAFANQPAVNKGMGCTASALTWIGYGADAYKPEQFAKGMQRDFESEWLQQWMRHMSGPHISLKQIDMGSGAQHQLAALTENETTENIEDNFYAWPEWQRRRWFSSYSGLIRNRPVDEPDYDQLRSEDTQDLSLPRGAQFGTAVHGVFENIDFYADISDIIEVSKQQLREQHIEEEYCAATAHMVKRVCDAEIPGTGQALKEAAQRRFAELEVLLPVTDVSDIADVFAQYGGDWAFYAKDIAGIQLPTGFFTGIIDLVYEQQGRFHVLDWKTNDLAEKGGYTQEAMALEMRHHHYVLQYHLYMIALQRYLRRRLINYSYEEHMGSAHYVFVRGVDTDAGNNHGWYHQRPSKAMIDALDACFGAAIYG